MSGPSTILLSGMFDMENYGDLLFPLVAERRLAAAGYRVRPVAPSRNRPSLPDALAPIDIADMFSDEEPATGIVVGGGYIIHASSLEFLDHYAARGTGNWSGAGLWLGATLAAALRDVPVAWNAPGVPHPFSVRQAGIVAAALRAASYAAVRDRGSLALLAPPADCAVAVVPDPIAELPYLWPRETLAPTYRTLLARKGIESETRLLAVHVRNRSIAGLDTAGFAAALREFAAAQGVLLLLIAVGQSHDDPAVARRLAAALDSRCLLLDDPLSLREITAALANSALYVGASLHGYIVSAAYGVPGVLVGRPPYQKFPGFLDHTGRPQDLARDWETALTLAAARARESRSPQMPQSVMSALDNHWSSIVQAMGAPHLRRGDRQEFAAALLRVGIQTDGPGWAIAPVLNRRMRAISAATATPAGGVAS